MLSGLMRKKAPEAEQPSIQSIGRFQLLEQLGKGAQGIVYLAKDLELNRQVAIKTLLHKSKDSEQIFNEARNVGSLEHHNIIPLYEIGAYEDRPYLVYPYVKGITLREYLNNHDALTVIETVTLISNVLDGLAHAHNKGVIHRDLNPSNILLDENDMPRIMDFGISDFAGNSTSENEIKGTVQYMSPEQLNNKPVGAWSDIFSIGVILYEMLTGHHLFKANNSMVSIYKIINESILPPSKRNKAIDKGLDNITMKALAKTREQRYASAIEMKADIDAYLEVENGDVDITNVPVIENKQNAREQASLLLLERCIEKNPDFPVMGNNITHMMALKNDQKSADELSEIILRDQSLSSKILRMVNSASYGQFGGEIKTISRAIVILGISQIQSMSISIMVFEKLTDGPMAELLKSNACQSFLSATFARHLTKKSKSINSEEAFLASMFHNIGKQITIYYLPDEYNEILNLVIEKGIDEDKACKRSLGMTFTAIGQYIADKWQLPENIMAGIQVKPVKPTRKPSNSKEYLTQLSSLTNEIIEGAAIGNNVRSEKRLKEIVARYQASFNLDYEKVIQMLNYLMKELIAYCDLLSIDYRNNNFCKNFISFINHDFNFDEETNHHEENSDNINNNKGFLESTLTFGIARITGLLYGQYELPQLLNIVMHTIHRGLDCKHVILFMRDNITGQMQAHYGAGENITEVMRRFHFPISEQDDIFSQAYQHCSDFFIPEVVHSAYLEKIPDWCKKTTTPKNMLIYSIEIKSKCHGLLYVDNATSLSTQSKTLLNYINILRKQTEQAISQKNSTY